MTRSPARAPQDIELCAVAIRHACDSIPHAWRFAFALLGGLRRWMFLPALCSTVPVLVVHQGGDALSVCFNTVAVLFLCEIDNLAYAIGLGEKLRARVEVDGRVELGEVEADALALSKIVHVCVLGVVVPCGVFASVRGGALANAVVLFFLPFFAFWLAGVVEVVAGVAGVAEACKEVGRVTGQCLLGYVVYVALWYTSHAV